MKTKHTQGEWSMNTGCFALVPLTEKKKHELRINQDTIYSIEVRLGDNIPIDIYGLSIEDATRKAKLTVASADLLEALQKAYEHFAPISNQWEGRDTPEGQFMLQSMKSAINKSTS